MGCLASKAAVADGKKGGDKDKNAGEGEDGGDGMDFGNPLQGGKGGSTKKVTWKASSEQSEEDMRRSRLMISTFDGLLHKLRSGKKEHEFVAALLDIETFTELKAHGVPDDAQKLLLDTRNALCRNKVRAPFWRTKAQSAFISAMSKMPIKMDLGNWVDVPSGAGAPASGAKKKKKADEDEDAPIKKPTGVIVGSKKKKKSSSSSSSSSKKNMKVEDDDDGGEEEEEEDDEEENDDDGDEEVRSFSSSAALAQCVTCPPPSPRTGLGCAAFTSLSRRPHMYTHLRAGR